MKTIWAKTFFLFGVFLASTVWVACGVKSPTPQQCISGCTEDTNEDDNKKKDDNKDDTKDDTKDDNSTTNKQTSVTNIALHAKVTASAFHEVARPIHIKDGYHNNSEDWNKHKYVAWVVRDDIDTSWIKLEWPTPVTIKSVNLKDLPGKHDVLSGTVEYVPVEAGKYLPSKRFSRESGFSSSDEVFKVDGAGDVEVKSMTVKILSHSDKSLHAGFSEIEVLGDRVESKSKDVAYGVNLAEFSKISWASSVFEEVEQGQLAGAYSANYAIDGDKNTLWVGTNGTNTTLDVVFDKPYCIKEIYLPSDKKKFSLDISANIWGTLKFSYDTSGIKKARVIIDDKVTFEGQALGSAQELSIQIDKTKVAEAKLLKFEFPEIESNENYVAIDELRIIPCDK